MSDQDPISAAFGSSRSHTLIADLVKNLRPHFVSRSKSDLADLASQIVGLILPEIEARILTALSEARPWMHNMFVPSIKVYALDSAEPPMPFSTCSARDFFHPRYTEVSRLLDIEVVFHRKHWEWVYIYHWLTTKMGSKPQRGLPGGINMASSPPESITCAGRGS